MTNKKDIILTNEEIKEFIIKGIELLKEKYVFKEVVTPITNVLADGLQSGKFKGDFTSSKFKKLFDKDLQSINGDKHLHVHIQEEDSNKEEIDEEEMMREYKRIAEKNNFGFHRMERLPGNIGYVDLRVFYDNSIASNTAIHAMGSLSHTDALILDLRQNIGGSPYMVAFIASYFFSEPTHMDSFYSIEDEKTSQVWTLPYVPGELYLDKPVYILTSKKTFSAGEMFAYALKHLNRATIIGESTGGGANPGRYHQLTKHLRLFVPSGKSVSPLTGTNWDGHGVTPDVSLNQTEAYDYAYRSALKFVREKFQDKQGYRFLVNEIDEQLEKM